MGIVSGLVVCVSLEWPRRAHTDDILAPASIFSQHLHQIEHSLQDADADKTSSDRITSLDTENRQFSPKGKAFAEAASYC